MGYVVKDSLWCPSTAFTPMPWWILHINGLFIIICQHIFGPISSFLLSSCTEYSCIHVQSFNKNNRNYSPPKINYSFAVWNHNKCIKFLQPIWRVHFASYMNAVCTKKNLHSSNSSFVQLAYAKITVYCNLNLSMFHLGCPLICILSTVCHNIFKGSIPRFMKSICTTPVLSSEILLPLSHSISSATDADTQTASQTRLAYLCLRIFKYLHCLSMLVDQG